MRFTRWIAIAFVIGSLAMTYDAPRAQMTERTQPNPPTGLSHDDETKLLQMIGILRRVETSLVIAFVKGQLDKSTLAKAVAAAQELNKIISNPHCEPGECVDPMTGLCVSCEPGGPKPMPRPKKK